MPYKARYPSFQKCGKEFCPIFDFCFSAIQQHGKNYPKFGKENPDFGKNYPNAAKPFKMEKYGTILNLVKKIHFIIEFIFLDFQLSVQPVKIIQSLVKKIQSDKNYPNFGKINPKSSENYPFAVKPLKIKFPASYPAVW